MNPDGSDQQRLTATAEDEFDPALSPDGSRIAFTRLSGDNRDIWTMGADGSGPVQITTSARSDRYPAWSPDGTRLAFRSNRDKDFDLYVVRLADGAVERVTEEPGLDSDPDWSPTELIAFSGTRGNSTDIFAVGPGSDIPIQLTSGDGIDRYPSFSPDGSQIAYLSYGTGERGIFTMNANGTDQRRLGTVRAVDSHPSWSPDGARIAFDRVGSGGATQITVMNAADGGDLATLTADGANLQPSWSADASLPGPPQPPPPGPPEEIVPKVAIFLSAPRKQTAWKKGRLLVRARTDQAVPLAVKGYIGVRVNHRLIRTLVYTRQMQANRTRTFTVRVPRGVRGLIRSSLRTRSRVRVAFSTAALNAHGELTRAKTAMYAVR